LKGKITVKISGVKCGKCGEGIESSIRVEADFNNAQLLCPSCINPFADIVREAAESAGGNRG
jgi:formylmethanofuran dehydrogenase subunit E